MKGGSLWVGVLISMLLFGGIASHVDGKPAGMLEELNPDGDIDRLTDLQKRLHEKQHQNEIDDTEVQPEPKINEGKVNTVYHDPGNSYEDKVLNVLKEANMAPPAKEPEIKMPPPLPLNPQPLKAEFDDKDNNKLNPARNVASMADVYFLAVVAGCSVAGLIGLVVAGVCWYRLQKNVKAASEAEFPAYGVTGPTKERISSPGDRKLAQSAQMYHYQHQKQQMIAMEKANEEMNKDDEDESEEENEEGDYTVYECPGLAPTGEMEVKNPLFSEETPVTPSGEGGQPDSDQK